jgi:hypothetical protein
MGAIKNHAMDMAEIYFEFGQRELKDRLVNGTPDDLSRIFSTLPFVRTNMDRNGFFTERSQPSELSDKVFIGGEGIEKNEIVFCRECLWEFQTFLGISYKSVDNNYQIVSKLLPHLSFTMQNDLDSCPVDEPDMCQCGNWMWDRMGHDVLLDHVANGDISPDVATAWINRNLSLNLDTRSYNVQFIGQAIRDWESRWQG